MPAHVGRFAPSPTGPLHAGSVVAALGSYLEARATGGRWRLRIDDIDPPRQEPGAVDRILRQLETLGLEWDCPVLYQSSRLQAYQDAFQRLRAEGNVYRCSCSRRQLAVSAAPGPLGRIYPGTCRARSPAPGLDAAWRLRLPAGPLGLDDGIQGPYRLDGQRGLGDPIVLRRDGLWSYHIANAVDDTALGITDVVRGADLIAPALVQVALQGLLGLPTIRWWHLPTLVDGQGHKLSKQTGAGAVDERRPVDALLAAWRRLGQAAPAETPASVAEFHAMARAEWDRTIVPAGPISADEPT